MMRTWEVTLTRKDDGRQTTEMVYANSEEEALVFAEHLRRRLMHRDPRARECGPRYEQLDREVCESFRKANVILSVLEMKGKDEVA